MAQSTFSLQWEAHRNNICNGLSILQQNGEFVDMTLAADGHLVKVHQMIMALASPYFKDLISSAEGRHPVIFLNKISYSTLSAILEYIYTGEVLISIENLSELVQTAKELHIKGLEDMKLQDSMNCVMRSQSQTQSQNDEENGSKDNDEEVCYFEITGDDPQSRKSECSPLILDEEMLEDTKSIPHSETDDANSYQEEDSDKQDPISFISQSNVGSSLIQYTVSNQGSLQIIVNRFIYYLKHCNRDSTRQWRCVDYLNKIKCPAVVVTKNNIVKKRIAAHVHCHHDRRIMKKVGVGAVYGALQEAEQVGAQIKGRSKEHVATAAGND